eukprot:2651509-Pleurochrysis_carterae.AAC.1
MAIPSNACVSLSHNRSRDMYAVLSVRRLHPSVQEIASWMSVAHEVDEPAPVTTPHIVQTAASCLSRSSFASYHTSRITCTYSLRAVLAACRRPIRFVLSRTPRPRLGCAGAIRNQWGGGQGNLQSFVGFVDGLNSAHLMFANDGARSRRPLAHACTLACCRTHAHTLAHARSHTRARTLTHSRTHAHRLTHARSQANARRLTHVGTHVCVHPRSHAHPPSYASRTQADASVDVGLLFLLLPLHPSPRRTSCVASFARPAPCCLQVPSRLQCVTFGSSFRAFVVRHFSAAELYALACPSSTPVPRRKACLQLAIYVARGHYKQKASGKASP